MFWIIDDYFAMVKSPHFKTRYKINKGRLGGLPLFRKYIVRVLITLYHPV